MTESGTSAAVPAIRARGLSKTYPGAIHAVQGVDMDAFPGELVAIMGKSGSGKSTLLNLLGTLDKPDGGSLEFHGKTLQQLGNLARFRLEELGFVFQLHCLLPHLTLLDNVALPLQGRTGATAKARQALEEVGLSHRLKHRPATVSGGERQRAAIARAIVNGPRILLADEPTGNVDSETELLLLDLFDALRVNRRMALVVVTHDATVARRADRVLHYRDGRIERTDMPTRAGSPS